MFNDEIIFWWPNLRADLEKKAYFILVAVDKIAAGRKQKSVKTQTTIRL